MVTFSEFVTGKSNVEITKLRDLGVLSFGKRKNTDKNEASTPHYEFTKGYEMYENNPIVASALDQYVMFIIPNKHLNFYSTDKKSVEFMEEWCRQRPHLIQELKNILLNNLLTGNSPIEKRRAKTVKGSTVLDNIFASNDMMRLYVNPDVKSDGSNAYFYELPIGIKTFKYLGELVTPGFYNITYIANYQYTYVMKWGFFISKDKLDIYQTGFSRFGIYGRSPMLSAIDANNIMMNIISSWDTIARTRQIDQKIISISDGINPVDVSQERLDKLADELENNEKSFTLLNIPLKFVQQEVNVAGKYDLLENVFNILRRMIIMNLLPQHLTAWSDSSTTQGSHSSMPPFLARIRSKQNEFIQYLGVLIIDDLRKTYPWLAKDLVFEFEEPRIMPDSVYINTIGRLRDSNIISLKQASEYLDKLGIINQDLEFIDKQQKREDSESDIGHKKTNVNRDIKDTSEE